MSRKDSSICSFVVIIIVSIFALPCASLAQSSAGNSSEVSVQKYSSLTQLHINASRLLLPFCQPNASIGARIDYGKDKKELPVIASVEQDNLFSTPNPSIFVVFNPPAQ